MIEIRKAMPGDTWLILPTVRQSDIDELAAIGYTPEECLRNGLRLDPDAVSVWCNREPIGMVGTVDYGDYRLPWAVFTTLIDKHPLPFLRASRAWVRALKGPLINFVDVRNTMTIHWLRWLGFTIDDPIPYGMAGEPFHRFWKA